MRTGRSIGLGLLLCTPLMAMPPVRYELTFANALHHEAEVRATFTNISTPELQVVMSHSSPGRYALHEFAEERVQRSRNRRSREPSAGHSTRALIRLERHRRTTARSFAECTVSSGTWPTEAYNAIGLAPPISPRPAAFVWRSSI